MSSGIKTRLLRSQSDERLLALAHDRSEIAFEALARRYRRPLLRHCRQLCLSEEMAQEVLRRTLSKASSGIRAGLQPRELWPWLDGIARRAAAEQLCKAGLLPAAADSRASASPASPRDGAALDGAPTAEEVLALRGALAAMRTDRSREGILVHSANGDKAKVGAQDAFEIAGSAVRGLLGGVRRGISALAPPPLLAWAMGRAAEGGATSERIAELGAGGGAAGLAGLAVKGLAAITAGVAITGAVIAGSKGSHHAGGQHRAPASMSRVVAASVSAPAGARAGVDREAVRHGQAGTGSRSQAHRSDASAKQPARTPTQSTETSKSTAAPASPGTTPSAPGPTRQSSTPGSHSTAGAGASTATTSTSVSVSSSSSGSSAQASGQAGGVGVQVSVGSGSGQPAAGSTSGGAGSTGSGSSSGQSGGVGVGVSVSLEPLGSVGVHVSLP